MDRSLAHDLLVLTALVASAVIFYLSGVWALAFGCLIIFGILAWFRVDLALLATVFFVPYFMHPKYVQAFTVPVLGRNVASHAFPPNELLLGVTLVAAIVVSIQAAFGWTRTAPGNVSSIWHTPEQSIPTWSQVSASPYLLPGSLFLGAASVSAAFAAESHAARTGLLLVVVEPIIFFCLVTAFVGGAQASVRRRFLLVSAFAIVATGVMPSLIGLGQLLTNSKDLVIVATGYTRIRAWYGSPDNLGLLLDRTIPMAAALALAPVAALMSGLPNPASRGSNWRVRLGVDGVTGLRAGLVACFGIMGIALVCTFVLGAWIGVFVSFATLIAIRFRIKVWKIATALAVAAILIGLGASQINSFASKHQETGGRRVDVWHSAVNMIKNYPVVGIGLDNFEHYYAPTSGSENLCPHGLGYMQPSASAEPCLSHPHNAILDFWLSTGIGGLAAFIWLQLVFWKIIWQSRAELARNGAVLLGVAMAMLAGLIHGMVDNGYFLNDLSMLTWFLFGLAGLWAVSTNVKSTSSTNRTPT